MLRSAAAQDCEFTYLSVQILHLMGVEGPHTKQPARYIRYIYNRIILENATVRAAAVSSLALFGAGVKDLTPRIVTLLKRALYDNDDEARLLPLFPSNSRSLAFSVATSVNLTAYKSMGTRLFRKCAHCAPTPKGVLSRQSFACGTCTHAARILQTVNWNVDHPAL